MVEGNSLHLLLRPTGGGFSPSPDMKSGRLERTLLRTQMSFVLIPGVCVAESAMEPPSLHPEPGRAPWQRRRVLRG
jgi:hypothetical protein